MGPAPGLATHHAYMGEAGRLPGMDATTCCTGWTKFFSSTSNELLRA